VGLAWDVDTYGDGPSKTTCVSKDGSARGFKSNMEFIPAEHRGAFVMLNARPPDTTAREIVSDLINRLPAAPRPAKPPGQCGVYVP
jgi:hypothetical protein